MIHWTVMALFVVLAGLLAYAVGEHRGILRGEARGLAAGRQVGYQAGRSERWAAQVRVWADREGFPVFGFQCSGQEGCDRGEEVEGR